MKSRRFQLVIPNDAFAVLQRLQGVYGGSLSSVVRRAVTALAAVTTAIIEERTITPQEALADDTVRPEETP